MRMAEGEQPTSAVEGMGELEGGTNDDDDDKVIDLRNHYFPGSAKA